jgi:hypothetical protein
MAFGQCASRAVARGSPRCTKQRESVIGWEGNRYVDAVGGFIVMGVKGSEVSRRATAWAGEFADVMGHPAASALIAASRGARLVVAWSRGHGIIEAMRFGGVG